MVYEKSFPIVAGKQGPDLDWAVAIYHYVKLLKEELKVEDLVFVGTPAEQWRLACGIMNDASRT